jgi:energy-converting hydrogenase Eha subunit G
MRDDQNLWNFIFTVLFVAFFAGLMYVLYRVNGELPTSISLFDLLLIILATFRLIRLFVYDKIFHFIRELFVRTEEVHTEQGVAYIERTEYEGGPLRTISELLGCPWCFGIWCGLMIAFFYFLTPLAWFPILVLAISGLGTIFQLISNFIGWSAENKKLEAQQRAFLNQGE